MNRVHSRAVFSLSALLLASSIAWTQRAGTAPPSIDSAVPTLVNFTGTLTDLNGKPLAGVVGVTFALYANEQALSPLWLETQNVTADKSGHYSVQLGATSSTGLPSDIFVAGEARWLGVQPEGQAEYPRVMLLSVPYAMKAGDAQTLGGLPASAFLLAAGGLNAPSSPTATQSTGLAPPASSNVTTTGGTVNTIPLFTTATNIQSSAMTQTGSGTTAKIGIGTTTPATTLDVKGAAMIRGPASVVGTLSLPATGTATSTKGANSQPETLVASAFNSGTNAAVSQSFQWQAEPAGNDTSTASGSLNLLFGQGTSKPAETGLSVAANGQITFATGQSFPGTGSGTVTSVASGAGLTGGPITSSGTLNIANAGVTNAMLANPSITLTPGTDLTGGGVIALGGSTTLNLDTTKVPQLSAANTFTGNQTVNGNVSATGVVTGSSYQIGSNLFAYGSYAKQNAFLGFAGNTTTTGSLDTAAGYQALFGNTSGYWNSALGTFALYYNSAGVGNSAVGMSSLNNNTTGSWNTAVGNFAGRAADNTNVIGSNNTFLGYSTAIGTGSINAATPVGASAEVDENNAMVLGSIKGVNGALADIYVGIGTTTPQTFLHVNHAPPSGGVDVVDLTSGGATDVASLLIQNTSTGGQRLRAGAGTGVAYLASSAGLNFVTADTGTPSFPSPPAMTIGNSGNVAIQKNLSIGGDTAMSHNPRLSFSASFPGSFCDDPTCGGVNNNSYGPGGLFVPDQNIAITHVSVTWASPIDPSCAPVSIFGAENYFHANWTQLFSFNLPACGGTCTLPQCADFPLAAPVSVPAGNLIFVGITPTSGCNLGASAGGIGFVNVQYVMQ